MALIIKKGNQLSKIYAPEMDVSRSSLLSISNDISGLRNSTRLLYRYDNKLEDYNFVWVSYDELNQATEFLYEVPETHIGDYYKQRYVRKNLTYDANRNITSMRYHECDYIIKELPKGVFYENFTLYNDTDLDFDFVEGEVYDLNGAVLGMNALPETVRVVQTGTTRMRLENFSTDTAVNITAGDYNIGISGFVTLPDLVIPALSSSAVYDFLKHERFKVPATFTLGLGASRIIETSQEVTLAAGDILQVEAGEQFTIDSGNDLTASSGTSVSFDSGGVVQIAGIDYTINAGDLFSVSVGQTFSVSTGGTFTAISGDNFIVSTPAIVVVNSADVGISTMSSLKAEHILTYDSNDRIITSTFV